MRKNQVTITIERFGDQVPKDFSSNSQKIVTYCDSNDIYTALSGAFFEALAGIKDTSKDRLGSRRNHFNYDQNGNRISNFVKYDVIEKEDSNLNF
ncbi:hypothetical protein ACEN4K_09050 [Marinilactibacillus psychrotolerans]|uniref:hypothetical protein n=1 Tax=Marinilactibacillus psychrotolerans TaxID=191770 RepID=UPI003884831C